MAAARIVCIMKLMHLVDSYKKVEAAMLAVLSGCYSLIFFSPSVGLE